jgi:hypothetical protein
MARQSLQIQTGILGGISATQYAGADSSYNFGLGIDPDFPIAQGGVRTSGQIVPVAYKKFSSTNISGYPLFIITNPKGTTIYVYASDGKFVSYSSSLASETLVGTPTSGAGNGAAYYNNYIYLSTPTNIARYGPLDGVPALTNTVWTAATLGSQSALINTTYPSLRGASMPNHPLFAHQNNVLYAGDIINGKGVIHKIKTKKVTSEGDTNDGTAASALTLPFGYKPTCFSNWGNDLVIGAIQTTNVTVSQGKAALFFWDTVSSSFYRQVKLDDPLVTAMWNQNGNLFVWTGSAQGGVRLSLYTGGNGVSEKVFLDEGYPPLQGAVCGFGSRVVWGGFTTYPTATASLFAYGSKRQDIQPALHNIAVTSSTGANQTVTAVADSIQHNYNAPPWIIGWGDDSAKGIDKLETGTSTTFTSVFRSAVTELPGPANIIGFKVPLGAAVAANMTITPKLYYDDASASKTLKTINATNFPNSDRWAYIPVDQRVRTDFLLELAFTGTVPLPVKLPITAIYEPETNP